MERPKAITAAAIVSGALLAGSLGMTANAGILSSSGSSRVGQLSPVSETTAVTAEAQQPEETAATPVPGAPEAKSESHAASEPRTAPPTVAAGRSTTPPPVTTTKPKTEPGSEVEKPETTTPHVTEPPEVTSTTAPGATTTTQPRHDDGATGTGRDD